jgi:WD40 repeat protein
MPSLHAIPEPYKYIDTRGKPLVTTFFKRAPDDVRKMGRFLSSCLRKYRDGDYDIVTGSTRGVIQIWHSLTGKLYQTLYPQTVDRPDDNITSVCDLEDSLIAFTGFPDKNMYIMGVDTAEIFKRLPHYSSPRCVCAIRNGNTPPPRGLVASAEGNGQVLVWSIDPDGVINALNGHMKAVNDICSIGNMQFVSASDDTTLRVWEAKSGVFLKLLNGHAGPVTKVCDMGNGLVASGSKDKTLRVWEVGSGKCLHVLQGHKEGIISICSLGNQRLVSSSLDEMRIWDLTKKEANYKLLKIKKLGVIGIHALNDKNKFICVSSFDITIWDITDVDTFPKPDRSALPHKVQNFARSLLSPNKLPETTTAEVAVQPTPEPKNNLIAYVDPIGQYRGGRRSRKNRSVKGKSRKFKKKKRR